MRALLPRLLLPSVLLLAVPALVACHSTGARNAVDVSKLPAYSGPKAELFNDAIEPAAFGLALDRPHFRGDARFRERAQTADVVAEMKVTTVTIDKVDERQIFHLRFQRITDLAGKDPEGILDLTIKEGSPGYAVLTTVQTRARDKTLVVMWKYFREGEDQTVHYYIAPDDQETVGAVKEALALQEVSR